MDPFFFFYSCLPDRLKRVSAQLASFELSLQFLSYTRDSSCQGNDVFCRQFASQSYLPGNLVRIRSSCSRIKTRVLMIDDALARAREELESFWALLEEVLPVEPFVAGRFLSVRPLTPLPFKGKLIAWRKAIWSASRLEPFVGSIHFWNSFCWFDSHLQTSWLFCLPCRSEMIHSAASKFHCAWCRVKSSFRTFWKHHWVLKTFIFCTRGSVEWKIQSQNLIII